MAWLCREIIFRGGNGGSSWVRGGGNALSVCDRPLFVSELCLGTMTFGGSEGIWGQIGQLRQDEADALVRSA